jgi:hypothetical protein
MDESGWISNPGSFRVLAVLILKGTVKHKDFFAPRSSVFSELCAGLPFHERAIFRFTLMKRHNRDSGCRTPQPSLLRRVDTDGSLIGWLHLPEFDEDCTSNQAMGTMFRTDRISHVHSGTKISALVGEHTFQNIEFLATGVDMRGERAAGRISYDTGCPSRFGTFSLKHSTLYTGKWAVDPFHTASIDNDSSVKIYVDVADQFIVSQPGIAAN